MLLTHCSINDRAIQVHLLQTIGAMHLNGVRPFSIVLRWET